MCAPKHECDCTPPKQAKQPNKNVGALINNVKNVLEKAGTTIAKQGAIPQLAIGTVSGWCTGFLTTKIGRKAAFAVGGTLVLASAAKAAGLVKIDFEKFGQKIGSKTCDMQKQLQQNCPNIKSGIAKYGRGNTMFAAGFIGGFMLGLAT